MSLLKGAGFHPMLHLVNAIPYFPHPALSFSLSPGPLAQGCEREARGVEVLTDSVYLPTNS